jgi:class 3 adenylate cyclase
MSVTKIELEEQADYFFNEVYDITNGYVVPSIGDLPFGTSGKEIELAMLFVDLRESTKIVRALRRETSAKMYKTFLWGVSKICRDNDGEVRSFNGDGVLVAFIGENKEANATRAALQMSFFIKTVLKPRIQKYIDKSIKLDVTDLNFGIGIDAGTVLVVRGGIKGENNNDLVWVGDTTNTAVKLSGYSKNFTKKDRHIFISKNIYSALPLSLKERKNGDLGSGALLANLASVKIWDQVLSLVVGGGCYTTSHYSKL